MLNKKVKTMILVVSAVVLVCIAIIYSFRLYGTTFSKSNLYELQIEDLKQKIKSRDTFLLYIGRDTCPACVDFLPRLSKFLRRENIKCYYLDSERTQENTELKDFRDMYEIQSVPSLLLFHKGSLTFRFTTSDEYGNNLYEEFDELDQGIKGNLEGK